MRDSAKCLPNFDFFFAAQLGGNYEYRYVLKCA